MTLAQSFIGIDIAQAWLDVFDSETAAARRIANDGPAIAHLPPTVIRAQAGTQSTVGAMNDAFASPDRGSRLRTVVSRKLVWVPAGSASLRAPG
jgi:hypothetical protein